MRSRLSFSVAVFVLAVMLVACTPQHPLENQDFGTNISAVQARDIDWHPLVEDYDGDMFKITTVRFANRQVSLLGFLPRLMETHEYVEHDIRILFFIADSRRQCFVVIVQAGDDVRMAELISRRSFVDGVGLPSFREIYEALHGLNHNLQLISCDPQKVYVEPRLFHDLAEHGVHIPSRYEGVLEQELND